MGNEATIDANRTAIYEIQKMTMMPGWKALKELLRSERERFILLGKKEKRGESWYYIEGFDAAAGLAERVIEYNMGEER